MELPIHLQKVAEVFVEIQKEYDQIFRELIIKQAEAAATNPLLYIKLRVEHKNKRVEYEKLINELQDLFGDKFTEFMSLIKEKKDE